MDTQTSAKIDIENVSVKFRRYERQPSGLKEALMRWVRPPQWQKNAPPARSELWGVRDICLSLKDGDRLGILGHNGAGKSTLLKVISRIYRPTLGSVDIKGRMAALIEIGAGFSPELTGRENTFLNAAILGIPQKEMADRLDAIVEFAELQDFIDMPVKYYSTGMYLRLAFSIATEVSPDILILDELFAGGDVNFVEKATKRLQSFISASKILILVSHNLDHINQYCNRAIVLHHGHMMFDGAPQAAIDDYLKRMRQESGQA